MSPLHYPSGLKKFLEQELKQKCDAVFGEGIATVSVMADWGRPDSHLIELALDSRMDLIVLGASQRRGLRRLGSVSRAVVHYTHMNVASVPIPMAVTASASSPQFERAWSNDLLTKTGG
jgi:nucleotide-binding universal stress UspA family protein